MKASETNTRYSGQVRECANYSVRSIKKLFENENKIKNRNACSEDEKEFQMTIKEDLETFGDCVEFEEFKAKVERRKFSYICSFSFLLISLLLIVAGHFFNVELFFGSAEFAILSLLGILGVFGFLSKTRKTTNIISIRKAQNETTKKIVFCANTDAPNKRKISVRTERFLVIATIVGIISYIAYDLIIIFDKYFNLFDFPYYDYLNIISYVLIIFIIPPFCCIFTVCTNSSTKGVANNLSGCYACAGAMRYLSEFDLRLKNTDICILLTGGKNANNAGARAYIKNHLEEDKKIDTRYICVDTLNGIETFGVKTKSQKGLIFVKNSAKQAEVEIKYRELNYLNDDGKIFEKTGLPYATITTLPKERPEFYCSDKDNLDCLDVKSTEATIKILLDSAYSLDAE